MSTIGQPAARPSYAGRLELTWTNKDLTLLAHEDLSYEWVDPSDYRVSEVRLLHDVATVGQTAPVSNRATDNLLIRGDALHAMNALLSIPEFSKAYVGKVKLAYIDPPFNTGSMFDHYDDALEHSVWATVLRDRLVQIRDLLASDGSVWVHVDDHEQHRSRAVMDEVFGLDNFVETFLWQKVDSPNDNKVPIAANHDFIHVYAKDKALLRFKPKPDEAIIRAYGQVDPVTGHRFRDRLLKKNGKSSLRTDRPTMWFPISGPDGKDVWPIHDDGREARWAAGQDAVAKHVENGTLVWKLRDDPLNGGEKWVPYTREWAPNEPTRPWPTIWADLDTSRQTKAHHKAIFGTSVFDTPKPEDLLERILTIGTDPGDIVFDCYAGSGTTAAVAHKMGRRWVTSEWSGSTITTFTLPRLTKVVEGVDLGGISSAMAPTGDGLPDGLPPSAALAAARVIKELHEAGLLGEVEGLADQLVKDLLSCVRKTVKTKVEIKWSGGSGFRILDVGPSMFEEVEGRVYLAEWATDAALGEAVAAQFGYHYEADGPFSGRKGKTRLAVIDGLVNGDVIRLLVDQLGANEKVLVAGTAIDPECRAVLRGLRPGSTVKKVPASILDDYRIRRRDRLALASALDWAAVEEIADAAEVTA